MKESYLVVLAIAILVFSSCTQHPAEVPALSPDTEPISPPLPSPQLSPKVNSEYEEKLVTKFCPIIHLKGDGDVTENFEPEQIEIMIDEASLQDIGDPFFSEKATLSSLLQWPKDIYYLDLVGLEPAANSLDEYKLEYDKVQSKYQPTLYARVVEGTDGGHTVVQYWIFYFFNDWRNFHEGDWELAQLSFPGLTAEELLEKDEQPILAAYSQHQAGQRMLWSDMESRGLVVETHPVVYVAQGSHANYFIPGNFWSGLDFDDTGLSSWQVINPEQLDVVMLDEIEADSAGTEWLQFRGYWGEYLGFSISVLDLKFWQHGPFGPPWTKGEQWNHRWTHPDDWAEELPEYPDPFWVSLLQLPGDWSNQAFFCLFSPADLHVYDSQGRHVGMDEDGQLEIQITGAVYINPEGTDYKTIVIPNADISQEYMLVAEGTGSGTMEIKAQVPDAETMLKRYVEYTDVPVAATTIAKVELKPEIILPRVTAQGNSVRDTVTRLEIDNDGDGEFELESTPGKFEKQSDESVSSDRQSDIGQSDGQIKDGQSDIGQSDGQTKDGQSDIGQSDGQTKDGQSDIGQSDGQIKDGQSDIGQSDGQTKDGQSDIGQSDGQTKDGQIDGGKSDSGQLSRQ